MPATALTAEPLHALDWVCLGLMAACMCWGLWAGMVRQALSLAGWVLAFFAAPWGAVLLQQALPQSWSAPLSWLVAFVGVGLSVVWLCGWLARGASTLVQRAGLGWADRTLGLLFGLARALVLLLVLGALVLPTPLRRMGWWSQSACSAWIEESLYALAPLLPAQVQWWLHPQNSGE